MRLPLIGALVMAVTLGMLGAATGAPTRPAGVGPGSTPEDTALAVVEQRPAATGDVDPGQLANVDTSEGSGGTSIVRMDQQVDGVPVLGGEVVVAVDDRRRVIRVDGATSDARPRTGSLVTGRAARLAAVAAVRKGAGGGLVASPARLVLHDPQVMDGAGPPRARTAWEVTVTRSPMVRMRVYVDAATGVPYQAINLIRAAKSISVCDAGSTSNRWPCTPPYTRSNTATPSGNGEVDAAYDLTAATYDFYAGLGRDSIDDNGMRIVSTVNWCDGACPYLNAFWDGNQMVFGPGMASADDVVAHELTHGVTERTSNLVYWYQSGAINEALSDIMGELFDLQRGAATRGEWVIAEDSPLGVIRNMANPPAKGDPDRITSPYYLTGIWDNGGVHTNSGVANKAAYLIADGGAFNGRTVGAIGRSKSTVLWYQTGLTLRMSSDYSDLADALEQTCDGFASIGYQGFTSTDCAQVRSAVLATEMRIDPIGVPDACPAGGTSVSAFEESFSSGIAARWITSATVGSNQWYPSSATSPDGLPMTWPTPTSTNVRAVGTPDRSDSSLAMSNPVRVPSNGYLRFTHWHQFESSISLYGDAFGYQGYDAGVVEYSANNGATWTDIASLPAVNGYTGTINEDRYSDNTLEGRPGFIAASNGAVTTQVDLSSLAGQDVRFRFRQATDTGTGGYGWYIDQVGVHGCITVPDPPTVTAVTPGDRQLTVDFSLGGSGAAPSNVRYSVDDGTSWTTRSPASTASPLVITGLDNGTTYRVRLQAVSGQGTSGASNMVSQSPNGPVVRTIAITSPLLASYGFDDAAPTIAASPSVAGGDVTYTSATPAVCSVNPSTGAVSFLAAGTCSISAAVAESGNLLQATSSPVTFTVTPATPAPPTITGATAGDGQVSVPFVLAGTGGAPAANVEYSVDDGRSWTPRSPASTASPLVISGLPNGQAVDIRVRVVAPGGTSVQSNAQSATPVGPIARTIAITSSVAASYAFTGAPPALAATPSVVGGEISYASLTSGVCTVDPSTGVVAFVAAGSCSLTASAAASGNLLAATSAATTFSVTPVAPGAPTVTTVTSGAGQLAIAFTPGDPGGGVLTNVEYSLDDGQSWTTRAPASLASPLVVTGLPLGASYQVRLRAVGSGGTSAQSNSVAQSTTGPTARTIAITSAIAGSYGFDDTPPTVAAQASEGDGEISYASSTPGVCTVDPAGGAVLFVSAGQCTLSASIAASGAYVAATSPSVDFTIAPVAPAPPVITAVTAGDGQLSVSFTAASTGGVPATNVRYSVDDGTTWTTRSPASTSSPLVITGLENGRTYPVRISLVGPGGTGAMSAPSPLAPNGPIARTLAITSGGSSYPFNARAPVIVATPSLAGGAISYASSAPGVCTVDPTTGEVAFVSAGSCSITAAVAASGNLLPATSAPATFSITAVQPDAPTITWVSAGDAQLSVAFALYGSTGGAPATNVRYSLDGGANWVARSPASIASPLVLAGLTNGDAYAVRLQVVTSGGTSTESNLVQRAPNGPVTRTLVIGAPSRTDYRMGDDPPVLTASPSHAGGAITYSSSTPEVCTVDPATGAVRFVAPGTCRISAAITASANLSAATAAPVAFNVMAAAPAAPTPAMPSPPAPSMPAAVQAPAAASPAPAGGSAPAANVPRLPSTIRWAGGGAGAATTARPITAIIPAPRGTRISVRAIGPSRKAARGTCRISGTTARCSVRIRTPGRWTVVVTPITNGVPGRPVRSTVRVR